MLFTFFTNPAVLGIVIVTLPSAVGATLFTFLTRPVNVTFPFGSGFVLFTCLTIPWMSAFVAKSPLPSAPSSSFCTAKSSSPIFSRISGLLLYMVLRVIGLFDIGFILSTK
ncbi:hypothetical protein BC01_015 [Bacillus phage BC01]|nr:hypothetical protein BC01_015 [Bacillus phage BC01]